MGGDERSGAAASGSDPRRIRIQIRYDGTRYSGWQRQREQPTIQEEVERAIAEITHAPSPIYGSGRTDAGVHALGQVAHFDSDTRIPMESLPRALNAKLPDDIAISAAARVGSEFHARFSARRKTYFYRLFVGRERDPIRERFAFRISRRPDVAAMRLAARSLVGRHDFRSFVTGGADRAPDPRVNPRVDPRADKLADLPDDRRGTVREMTALRIWARGDSIAIIATAGGFLQHMVRNLSGLLVRVGDGKMPAESAREVLEARDRSQAPAALASPGLFLWRVDY